MAAKRLLAVFIAIIMVLSLAPAGVFTAFADGENILSVGCNKVIAEAPTEDDKVYTDYYFTPPKTDEYWICSVAAGDPCCNIIGGDLNLELDDYDYDNGIVNFREKLALTADVTYTFSVARYGNISTGPLEFDLFITTEDGFSITCEETEDGYIFAPLFAYENSTVSFLTQSDDISRSARDIKVTYSDPDLGVTEIDCETNDGVSSFTMPAADVTVSCVFAAPDPDDAAALSYGGNVLSVPAGQMGYYSFTAEEAGLYEFASHTSDCDPKATLYNSNQQELDSADDYLDTTDFRIVRSLEAGETIYLSVTDYYSGSISGTLTIELISPVSFVSHGLKLTGEIGVIFFTEILDPVDFDSSYVDFLIGKSGTQRMSLSEAEYNDNYNAYALTCYVGTYRMADKITPVIHWYDDEGVEQTIEFEPYSAEDYIDYALDSPDDFTTEEFAIVEALADLGYYTQQYLSGLHGYTVGDGENDKYAAFTTGVTGSYDTETVSAILQDYDRYNANIDTDKVENIAFSLNLESSTALYIYLTVKDGVTLTRANDYSYDTDRELTRVSANVYRIAVRDIKAYALNSTYNIQVYDGEENVVADLSISPLNYIKIAIVSSNNDALTNAACAVYYYYDAVNTLVSNSVPVDPEPEPYEPDDPDEPDEPVEP